MPQDLAALLVDGGAVSKADMDRAVARQSQLGGALDTSLLELELIDEGRLLPFLATASGLAAAPLEAFKDVDPRARRVFPGKVAERHRLAPLALDGRELSVVACHPVDAAAIDEIGFMLSLTLVPWVGVEWRVHELIHRLYGGQLPARLARLGDASRRAPVVAAAPAAPEVPEVPPPPAKPAAAPEPPASATSSGSLSIEEAFFAAGEAGSFTPTPAPAPPPAPPKAARARPPAAAIPAPATGPERSSPAGARDEASFADIEPERSKPSGFGEGAEPAEPLLAALEQAVDLYEELWSDKGPPPLAEGPPAEPTAPAPEPAPAVTGEPEAPAAPVVPAAPEAPDATAAEESVEPEEPEPPPAELDRSAPPRWTIDDARTSLAAAGHRDEVVLTALRFARDFFEYSALFAVTRDAVVGHDALGSHEDARSHCRGTAIYANDPGIVRTVLETRAPYLGPVVRDAAGTTNILDGLWRGTPRTVLLYPVLVADRPVAVLYADNGEAPVSSARLGDLLLFLSTVGGAFERIIRARKKRRKPAAPAADPPPVVEPPVPDPAPSWLEPPPTSPGQEPEAAAEPAPPVPQPDTPGPAPTAVAAPAEVAATPPEAEPAPEAPDTGRASAVDAAIATLLSAEAGKGDHVAPIVELLLDADPAVAAAARAALVLHRRERAVKPVPERMRRALLSGLGDRAGLAARTLAALRDVESIPVLIQALEGGAAQYAAGALAEITLQRFGANPQKWLKWWKENRGRTRAEWLFAALTGPDVEARVAAAGELRAAAEPPVRYAPDLPIAELEAAARAWWVWWSRQGISV